jgi:hypothetical protein
VKSSTSPKWPDNRAELGCVLVALGVYLLFQLHALAFHGYQGQDWNMHTQWIAQAAEHSWEFFSHYEQGRTNPPLYHLLAGTVKRLVAAPKDMLAIGLMNVVFGFIGACCTYGVIGRLIASPLLRVAAMVFFLFLPFAMIHAEVVASDALATPLFWILLWLVVRFPANGSKKAFLLSTVSIAMLLLAGLYVKFTFGSFVVASAVWIAMLWWTRGIVDRRLAVMLIVIVAVPALVGYREAVRFRSQATDPWGIQAPSLNRLRGGAMNLRSMVWFRAADADVLSAPVYNRMVEGEYDLLRSNKHSLPALIHLATFSDILNIYQYDPEDQYFGRRTSRNQGRMEVAVRSGIAASLLAVIGVLVLGVASVRGVVQRRNARNLPLFTVLLCCGAWFANIVMMFPFIPTVYAGGFWLPRLIAPALIGFFVVGFALVDQLPWKNLHLAVLVYAVAQSAIHASFLWPSP